MVKGSGDPLAQVYRPSFRLVTVLHTVLTGTTGVGRLRDLRTLDQWRWINGKAVSGALSDKIPLFLIWNVLTFLTLCPWSTYSGTLRGLAP